MKKIMLFIMLLMAMAFADDSYFAKVAARDAKSASERAETAAMKTLERIDQLTIQVINLQLTILEQKIDELKKNEAAKAKANAKKKAEKDMGF